MGSEQSQMINRRTGTFPHLPRPKQRAQPPVKRTDERASLSPRSNPNCLTHPPVRRTSCRALSPLYRSTFGLQVSFPSPGKGLGPRLQKISVRFGGLQPNESSHVEMEADLHRHNRQPAGRAGVSSRSTGRQYCVMLDTAYERLV